MLHTQGALSGLLVLDLTRVLAGPFCTMLLADMGAEVIKIEEPGKGDDSRTFGPFINGESSYYMNMNRNKRGVTLNLKGEEKDLFLDLVRKADIVVENYRPGTMEKLGIGYETLKEVNPRIIYGATSGFGHTGPNKLLPGYDIIGQAVGGLMSVTGWPDGAPTKTGNPMSDVLGGLSCALGILAAVHSRSMTGRGQKVDVALVDSVVAALTVITQIYLGGGELPQRQGNRDPALYPYDSFETKDGNCVIGAGNDKLFHILCDIMGRPELKNDSRFLSNPDRVQNHAQLKPLVENWSRHLSTEELVARLQQAGCPAAPVNTLDQLVKDPHIAVARNMFVQMAHPVAGMMTLTGPHIKLSDTNPEVRSPAPTLGQHNEEVYSSLLGLSCNAVAQLRKKGVI